MIRDTEPHERALYSFDPSAVNASSHSSRQNTLYPGSENGAKGRKNLYASSEPRKQSAVARVLGSDMLKEIQRSTGNTRWRNGAADGVNVEVLLAGAEKLCSVYPVAGASERIETLRIKYREIADSISHHEAKVSQQQTKLNRLNKSSDHAQDTDEDEVGTPGKSVEIMASEQDLEAEAQEIRELEAKKRTLEERVSGMEKDLGGLMR